MAWTKAAEGQLDGRAIVELTRSVINENDGVIEYSTLLRTCRERAGNDRLSSFDAYVRNTCDIYGAGLYDIVSGTVYREDKSPKQAERRAAKIAAEAAAAMQKQNAELLARVAELEAAAKKANR